MSRSMYALPVETSAGLHEIIYHADRNQQVGRELKRCHSNGPRLQEVS
jgi:hypothetical protein